jgi:hypothetical protein
LHESPDNRKAEAGELMALDYRTDENPRGLTGNGKTRTFSAIPINARRDPHRASPSKTSVKSSVNTGLEPSP